jgi:tetratricopeptide (TPR) repeat protein
MEFVSILRNNLNRIAFKTFKTSLQNPSQVNYFYLVIKQQKMKRILSILLVLLSLNVSAQTSEKYNSDYENFYRAEELFEKEQYTAARREFRSFINGFPHENDPMVVKARYYEAISALELYNTDAVSLLEQFNKDYPESIYKTDIYFRLGKFYYYKKKYKDALVWFNKLSIQDVEAENRDEFFFKMGYSNFREENFDAARNAFVEVKDGDSQYASPALYYYSHIAYQNEKYQLALEGFLKLEDHESFGKLVPYYIAQIYYLQGKYDKVTEYASKITSKDGTMKETEINLLIGDAYYRTGKYDEAVPFLEKYNRLSETTREEDYRLGYAYYKSGHYKKAVPLFDRAKHTEDSLGQVAYYHIGECMLKLDNKVSARSAFEGAAFIDADPVVQEDALYNYAILSYQLDINPYDEAVEAFEMYLNKYPDSKRKDDVYQYLVNVYLSTNNYTKALASLDKLPNKDVRLKQAYQLIAFNQGVERFHKNDFGNAIKSFQLVNKYPIDQSMSGQAVFWTADAYYRLNQFDKAIENYKKFNLLPSTTAPGLKPEANYNIGYCYWNKAEIYDGLDKQSQRKAMLKKAIDAFGLYTQSNPASQQKKADAYMRIADSYFVRKDNLEAVNFYNKAVALKSGYEDQALFYMAKTYGYMSGKSAERISNLLDIINNYPDSKYLLASISGVAETYKSNGQLDKALQYYNKIIFDYPSSVLVVDAKINIADIHFKQKKYGKAEEEYLAVIEEYGSDQRICQRVAQGLKDLYTAINMPDEIEKLADKYDCIQFSADEKENLYYLPALEAYSDSTVSDQQRYTQAIPKLEKYLEKFPSGRFKLEIQNYLADCHYNLGDQATAVAIYRETLDGPNTSFTGLASRRVSSYLYNEGKFEEAIPYYSKSEKISDDPEVLFNSKLGLMRCHYQIGNWSNATLYADKVLSNGQLGNDILEEAHYVKGMSNYEMQHFNDAKVSLTWLKNNLSNVRAAEARHALIDIAYQQGDYAEAHVEADGLLKMKPRYNYWVAKGLLTRSRVYMAERTEESLFQAERDLKSIRTHYPTQDDGIIDEANELWDELMQIKAGSKEIAPEGENTIEIEEENGN